MFTAKQYRAKAADYGEFLNVPRSPTEITEFRNLQSTYTTPAENEEWQADNVDWTRWRRRKHRENPAGLAEEEEQILKCLGAAVIMRWNTLPKKLQRELFDRADSIVDLPQTASLKGQIARFRHNHEVDERAEVLHDLWRFSCEMPDAPHLSKA